MAESVQTLRRRILGAQLRKLRESAGLTLEEAGAGMERAESTMSRLENGRHAVRALDVQLMLDMYDVTDERTRQTLSTLAKDGRKKGWWHGYSDVLSPAYSDLISLEDDAANIRTFEMALVPGLLQTEDYARAVLSAGRMTAGNEEVERFVQVRMGRQAVLTREEKPLDLWVILSEAALRQQLGGPDVLRSQLRHLHETSGLPNVTLQVLPFTAESHPGGNGPFVVLAFPEPAAIEVVLLENLTSSLYLEQEAELARYVLAFEHLRAAALDLSESRKLLTKLANDL